MPPKKRNRSVSDIMDEINRFSTRPELIDKDGQYGIFRQLEGAAMMRPDLNGSEFHSELIKRSKQIKYLISALRALNEGAELAILSDPQQRALAESCDIISLLVNDTHYNAAYKQDQGVGGPDSEVAEKLGDYASITGTAPEQVHTGFMREMGKQSRTQTGVAYQWQTLIPLFHELTQSLGIKLIHPSNTPSLFKKPIDCSTSELAGYLLEHDITRVNGTAAKKFKHMPSLIEDMGNRNRDHLETHSPFNTEWHIQLGLLRNGLVALRDGREPRINEKAALGRAQRIIGNSVTKIDSYGGRQHEEVPEGKTVNTAFITEGRDNERYFRRMAQSMEHPGFTNALAVINGRFAAQGTRSPL